MAFNMTREEFLTAVNGKYKGLYEYKIPDDKKIITPNDQITVICPKHGLFLETAYVLLNGMGCFKCYSEDNLGEKVK